VVCRGDWDFNITELGAGIGTTTRCLYEVLPRGLGHWRLVDNDPDMMRLGIYACPFADHLYADISDRENHLPYSDMAFSHGVLEHLTDDRIRNVTERLSEAGIPHLHYVPGLYDSPSFGDERLMSVEQWQDICEPDDIITFNNGLDYILSFYGDST